MSSLSPIQRKPVNNAVRRPINLAEQLARLDAEDAARASKPASPVPSESARVSPVPPLTVEAAATRAVTFAADVQEFSAAPIASSPASSPAASSCWTSFAAAQPPRPASPVAPSTTAGQTPPCAASPVLPMPVHVEPVFTTTQTRAPAADTFDADLEAARSAPVTMAPFEVQDAGAQGALMGAYQMPMAHGFGRSSSSQWNPRNWSRKQQIWTGVGVTLVIIIIAAAAGGSAHRSHGGSSGSGNDNVIGNAGCNNDNPDSICYGDPG